jgi:hypothetical protein
MARIVDAIERVRETRLGWFEADELPRTKNERLSLSHVNHEEHRATASSDRARSLPAAEL